MIQYKLPEFLKNKIDRKAYAKWLDRRARAHVNRDGRNGKKVVFTEYKKAIHNAVMVCKGIDAYTGEDLHWSKISQYNNKKAEKLGRRYKKGFALLPSVDHWNHKNPPEFRICAWRTNDAKSDMSYYELIEFCKKVLKKVSRKKV